MAQYLLNRPSGWYFRYIIPKRFKFVVSLKELRYPLATRFQAVANSRSRIVVFKLELYLSRRATEGMSINNKQLRQIVHTAIKEAREITLEGHINREKPLNPNSRRSELDTANYLIGELREALGLSDYRTLTLDSQLSQLLDNTGIKLDKNSLQFKQACRDLTAGHIAIQEEYIDLLNGVVPDRLRMAENAPQKPSEPLDDEKKYPPAHTFIDEFIKDKQSRSGIARNTVKEYENTIADLAFILEGIPANEVKAEQVSYLTETLKKLPKNRNKSKSLKGKTVQQLLDMNIPSSDRLSASTVQQKIAMLITYFDWLEHRDVIAKNYFKGRNIKASKEQRRPFSIDELTTIFNCAIYKDTEIARRKTTTASHWWLSLLALFSGARVSELTQMRLSDVREQDGVLYLMVIENGDTGQRLKTVAAKRDIPVHPELLRLGFKQYLAQLAKNGYDRLLPGFRVGERTPGQYASKWWRETLRGKYLPSELRSPLTPFHSFRHTFATEANDVANIPLEYTQQMLGHERKQMGATAIYSHGKTILALFDEIQKISFKGLDLTHLIDGWERHPLS
jgi:integrase